MKLLVFAHKPPPHHGQSYMVQLLLEKLGDAAGEFEVYHVDSRFSKGMEDIGSFRPAKIGSLLKYCFQAIWLRLRYGVRNFYFVPAPPKRAPLYRDWLIMALCRPFFPRIIYHWHSAGLGEWLRTEARGRERWLSKLLLYRPELSIVLGEFNRRDAQALQSKQTIVVPNGIPDPCPEFKNELLPLRLARVAARKKLARGDTLTPAELASAGPEAQLIKLLFIGMCFSQKGIFDAVEAVALANRKLQGTSFRVKLTVAGEFFEQAEKQEFERRIKDPDLRTENVSYVEYKGFVSGKEKGQLFRDHDCLCFPTWYLAENFPLVLLEAMAFGMSIIVTNWRGMPEFVPAGYEGLVPPKSPAQIAETVIKFLTQDYDPRLRARFLENYTEDQFAAKIKAALKGF
jgi:glycosyltransferase involved in cell wall biosynthesis